MPKLLQSECLHLWVLQYKLPPAADLLHPETMHVFLSVPEEDEQNMTIIAAASTISFHIILFMIVLPPCMLIDLHFIDHLYFLLF